MRSVKGEVRGRGRHTSYFALLTSHFVKTHYFRCEQPKRSRFPWTLRPSLFTLLTSVNDLKPRTKKFALDVILYSRQLPWGDEFTIIKRQLIRSATSTAANYRAAQRAKSKADFINKLGTTEEEADESLFWLECLRELATNHHPELHRLLNEANELTAILVTARKRARQ